MSLSTLPSEGEPIRLLAVIEASSITGPAKNLLNYWQYSRGSGVELHVATFMRGDLRNENVFVRRVRELGIPIHLIAESGPWDPAAIRGLRNTVEAVQPSVLQTHAVKSHFVARCASLPGHYPWVAFHHGYTWTSWKTRIYNELDRWSLRRADIVFTVSEPFRQELVAKGVPPGRVRVIHNAIAPDWGRKSREPDVARRLRQELNIPEHAKVAIIVGRLSLEKDHRTLLKAVASMRDKCPIHLVVVGDGPERGSIERIADELGIRQELHMVGQQPSAEPFYGVADIAVLSSRTEGSPNALLEAMASGVPAVATRVGGIPEIVVDGVSALLVEPGDVTGMAVAFSRIRGDHVVSDNLVQSARQSVVQNHHPVARARLLTDIYRKVSGEGGWKR